MVNNKNKKGGFFNFLTIPDSINNNNILLKENISNLSSIKNRLNDDLKTYLNSLNSTDKNEINNQNKYFSNVKNTISDANNSINIMNDKYNALNNSINTYYTDVNNNLNNKELVVSYDKLKIFKGGFFGSKPIVSKGPTAEQLQRKREMDAIKKQQDYQIEEQLKKDTVTYNNNLIKIDNNLNNLKLINNQPPINNLTTTINNIANKSANLNDFPDKNIGIFNSDFVSFNNTINEFMNKINNTINSANYINSNYGKLPVATRGGSNKIYNKNRMEELKYENIINNLIGGMKKIKIEKKDGSKIIIKKDKKGNNKIIKK